MIVISPTADWLCHATLLAFRHAIHAATGRLATPSVHTLIVHADWGHTTRRLATHPCTRRFSTLIGAKPPADWLRHPCARRLSTLINAIPPADWLRHRAPPGQPARGVRRRRRAGLRRRRRLRRPDPAVHVAAAGDPPRRPVSESPLPCGVACSLARPDQHQNPLIPRSLPNPCKQIPDIALITAC